jgi:outer membrane protein assembly factor BamB
MLKKIQLKALGAAALIALAGCESNEEVTEYTIAEIKPINAKYEVDVEWKRSAGNGIENYYSDLAPVIVGDTLFAASRAGDIYAFDKKNGDVIWSSDIRENPPTLWSRLTLETVKSAKLSGGITAAYNNLYMGTEDGELIAVSQETGEVIWRANAHGEVVSAPAAGEGWIVVNTTAGKIVALHPDTGEERWVLDTDVPALSLRGTSSPTIANGGVLVGTATGKLMVVILDKGLPAWEQAIGTSQGSTELERLIDVDSTPLVNGSSVYSIAYNGNLVALDVMSGRPVWKREYSSYRNLVLEGRMIYLTDAKGNVSAVDSASGIERWNLSDLSNRRLTQPVIYKDMIVVGDFEGYVHFIDKENGSIVARHKYFNGWLMGVEGVQAKMSVSNDMLYIQSRDGEVTALTIR